MTALRGSIRVLDEADRAGLLRLIDDDPIGQCVLHARMHTARTLRPFDVGGQLWGIEGAGGLRAALFSGGNLMPVGGSPDDLHALTARVAGRPRAFSSIVGRRDAVAAIWSARGEGWSSARAIRDDQPLLRIDRTPPAAPDPLVRVVTPADLPRYLPAALAMFSEELEMQPPSSDDRSPYRIRVAQLINAGLAFARFDDAGRVVYKAEIAAVSPRCTQIQGVWVHPIARGRGVGTAATAAVVAAALRLAPTASLYVNSYNAPDRAMYRRLGFEQVATMSTILF